MAIKYNTGEFGPDKKGFLTTVAVPDKKQADKNEERHP